MTNDRHAMVLGASGFIGKRLVAHLVAQGWSVDRVVRCVPPGSDSGDDRSAGIRTIQTELDEAGLQSALEISQPRMVFNLAAAGVGRAVSFSELVDGNPGLVARLVGQVDPKVTSRIIHAGTWSQYRIDGTEDLVTETDPMEPTSAYGAAKASAEWLGRTIGRDRGVEFVTLRLFNVYGPGENPNRLIPYVTRAVSTSTPADLTLGDQIRDFVHVDDVALAFEACATLREPELLSFNVATGLGTAVRDVALQALQAAGGDPNLLRFGVLAPRHDEPMSVVGDASAFTEATGWTPRIALSAGVADTVRVILERSADNG